MFNRIAEAMANTKKLLEKLLQQPKTFKYKDLSAVLASIGFEEIKTGKTSGSRVAFYYKEADQILRLHKPHPGDELKRYQIKEAIAVIKVVIDSRSNEEN